MIVVIVVIALAMMIEDDLDDDIVVDFNGLVRCELLARRIELCCDSHQFAHERHVHDTSSSDHLGLHGYGYPWRLELPSIGFGGGVALDGPYHGDGILLV